MQILIPVLFYRKLSKTQSKKYGFYRTETYWDM